MEVSGSHHIHVAQVGLSLKYALEFKRAILLGHFNWERDVEAEVSTKLNEELRMFFERSGCPMGGLLEHIVGTRL